MCSPRKNPDYDDSIKLRSISKILSRRYKDHAHYNYREPLTELIYILLSLRTGEAVYRPVFAQLRKRYPQWRKLPKLERSSELASLLKPLGFSNKRSRQIIEISDRVHRELGPRGLRTLRNRSDAEIEEYLMSLPGVGVKTARCVLMYSFDREVFPVDTHVWRVMSRLGFSRYGRLTLGKQNALQEVVPKELRFPLHVNLVSLGRDRCKSKPKCVGCPVIALCKTHVKSGL